MGSVWTLSEHRLVVCSGPSGFHLLGPFTWSGRKSQNGKSSIGNKGVFLGWGGVGE